MTLPNLATRVFHTPLMVAPAKARAFLTGLGPRILGADSVHVIGAPEAGDAELKPQVQASILDGRLSRQIRVGDREGYGVRDGVAVIPITNTLVHRGAWLGSYSGETSYEGISAQIEAAAEDPEVKGIALEIDSGGGQVSGCFTLAGLIRRVREHKPVHAFLADHAYSAAYALASQASRVVIPRAGGAGSIGVICLHVDYSAQLEEHGVDVTVISAGNHKGEGNPYEPLPKSVRESMESEMEALREIFAEEVVEGRSGAITKDDVLATEAACFLGADAVKTGLADEISDPTEAFEQFVSDIKGKSHWGGPNATSQRSDPVTKKLNKADDQSGNSAETETEGDASTTAPQNQPQSQSESQSGNPEGQADPVATEKARIMGILGCEEAKGLSQLAMSLADNPAITVDMAKQHLAAAKSEAPQQQTLSQEMDDGQDVSVISAPAANQEEESPLMAAHKRMRK